MKKILVLHFAIIGLCAAASAQCNTISSKDVDVTCNSLKSLMDCHLFRKDYFNALSVYLTFKNINEDYQTPLEVKKYFKETIERNKASLLNVRLTLNNTEAKPQGGFKSSMPDIIQVSN